MTIDMAAKILDPDHREHYDGMEEVNEACRMGMEPLKRQRWIPCSERLPEKAGFYLVATPRGLEILEFPSGDKLYRGTPCFLIEALWKVSGYVTPTGCPCRNRRRKERTKMDYKEAAEKLCDGYLDMPSGCDGCPLSTGEYDCDGNMVCALNTVFDPPTVDAVPVVRCRDCVSYGVDEYGDFRCNHPEGMDFPGDNDFCSYGQRKDQSANPGKMEGQPDGEP